MSEGYFTGGTAVITGAGSGFGASLAERFAAENMSVVALDIDGERAEQTAQAVRDRGGQAISMRVDVADRAQIEAAARATDEAFGGCTVLCANVGVQQIAAAERTTEAEWRWIFDVNLFGVVNTVNAFLPLLRQRTGGRHIALTASSSVMVPGARLSAYTASKFAVMGYGEALRHELAEEDIGVSIVFPASMTTRHMESSQEARPAEIGKALVTEDDFRALVASRRINIEATIASADHATRNMLGELEANQRFIITHGVYRDVLAERCDDLLSAYDRAQN